MKRKPVYFLFRDQFAVLDYMNANFITVKECTYLFNFNQKRVKLLIMIHFCCLLLTKIPSIYAFSVCKILLPENRMCKFFDKFQVCFCVTHDNIERCRGKLTRTLQQQQCCRGRLSLPLPLLSLLYSWVRFSPNNTNNSSTKPT